ADAHPALSTLGVGDIEVVDLFSPWVVDPHRTERSADGLVELEDDPGGLARRGRARRRGCAKQLRVCKSARRARQRSAEEQSKRQAHAACSHLTTPPACAEVSCGVCARETRTRV